MSKIELAKIGGITPETFNFSGRWDDSPPVILFPTCRLGYWIFILRWDRSMKTINAITPTAIGTSSIIKAADRAPVLPSSRVPANACGRLATIPANIIKDIPLPIPTCGYLLAQPHQENCTPN